MSLAGAPLNLSANQSPILFAVNVTFGSLALISVALRLISRRISHIHLWWDDWCILIAVVFMIGGLVLDAEDIKNGVGKHAEAVGMATVLRFLVTLYANELIYAPMVVAIKCSILCLYLRIFGIDETFSKVVYGFLTVTVAWGIATLVAKVFQCSPIRAAWNTETSPSSCIDLRKYSVGTNVPNIAIDIGILILPMPMVWNMNLPRRRKIGISIIFLLGAFTTGVSIVRVVAIASKNIDESDVTWDFAPSIIWSTIELCVGIMCSCLPVIAPLVRLVFGKVVGLSRGIKAKLANTHPSSIMLSRPSHRDRNFSRLEDNAANLHQGRSNEGVTDGNAVQLKNIYISDDIDIDSRPEG